MKALYIVDVQYDFLPNGALAVTNGDQVIPVILEMLESGNYDRIIVSEDWHPYDHTSFAKNHGVDPFTVVNGEMKWPVHCVQYMTGACTHDTLYRKLIDMKASGSDVVYFQKGDDPLIEEYCVSKDALCLDIEGVTEIEVVGLATDYCVKHTALTLSSIDNLLVSVNLNACRGVAEDSTKQAIEEMKRENIQIIGE